MAALPDARLIQAMTLTLLEAGERFTNPPMIAVQQAIRSDVQLYAGGITWVDAEYDERLGEVLRPLTQDKSGMPLGRDLRNDVKAALAEAFFLNKLNLPMGTDDKEMTAFETGQRVQEYIRQTLPLFEPVETDYNGGLCEVTFDLLLRAGAFGAYQDIPPSIRGQQVQFHFVSPLSEAIDAQKAGKLGIANQIISGLTPYDPSAPQMLDLHTAERDALLASGVPASWLRSEKTDGGDRRASGAPGASAAAARGDEGRRRDGAGDGRCRPIHGEGAQGAAGGGAAVTLCEAVRVSDAA